MEDVGRTPPPVSSIAVQEPSSINELDGWIQTLMQCKQLSEADVQRLCDKVWPPPLSPLLVEVLEVLEALSLGPGEVLRW